MSNNNEYVTYKAPKDTLTVEKCLELQRFIIDPSSVPYDIVDNNNKNNVQLKALSAGATVQKEQQQQGLTVQKMLEVQQKVLNNL
jgi:hypothetical protein